MIIKNVTIAGAGTLGSQIAWQTAFHGFNVTVYDIYEKGLDTCKQLHGEYAQLFMATRGSTHEEITNTKERLSYTTNLTEAIKDADLLSESIPENLEIKKSFYLELAKVAPEKTIFTTNTSTLLPSYFAKETGRPERFLSLHFANGIWDANVGEVMGHPGTASEIFDKVIAFAKEIGMVPIPIYKEQSGYVLNTLLVSLLGAAGNLLVKNVASPETVDKTWMITTGGKIGPFGMMDMVGMETIYNIETHWGKVLKDKASLTRANYYKEHLIDTGKLGIKTGEGFYKYPNPKFKAPDFLE